MARLQRGVAAAVHCPSAVHPAHWSVVGSQWGRLLGQSRSLSHCAQTLSSHHVPEATQSRVLAQVRTQVRVFALHFAPVPQSESLAH